jgi:hypothetical protein
LALRQMIEYLHGNRVRRGQGRGLEVVERRWFASAWPAPIAMDEQVLRELQWDAGLREQR